MGDLVNVNLLAIAVILIGLQYALCQVRRRLRHLEAQAELADKLLRHARLETQVAHGLAETTHRLIVSITNGEEARRNVQGEASFPDAAGPARADLDMLAQRLRYRQALEERERAAGCPSPPPEPSP